MATLLLAAISTAYATCYLQGTIVAFRPGNLVSAGHWFTETSAYTYNCGPGTVTCSISPNNGNSGSWSADVYAAENVYKYDIYSVTAAGMNSSTSTAYAWPTVGAGFAEAGWYDQASPNNLGGDPGFIVEFFDQVTGSWFTDMNDGRTVNGQVGPYWQGTGHRLASTATSCN